MPHLESERADSNALCVARAAVMCRTALPSNKRLRGAGRRAEHPFHVRIEGAQVQDRLSGPAAEARHDLQRAHDAGAGLSVPQARLDGCQLQGPRAALGTRRAHISALPRPDCPDELFRFNPG